MLKVSERGAMRRRSPLSGLQPATHDWRIVDRMIAARHRAGLSQRGVSARMGVKRHAVERWERYESRPTPKMLDRFAHAVGVPVSDLLAGLS